MKELEEERKVAIDAIRNLNLIPVYAEGFDPQYVSPSEVYLSELRKSDIIVFILDKYFSSHVENEICHAEKYHKPLFFFIRKRKDFERDKQLIQIIKEISRDKLYGKYSNHDELGSLIKRTLVGHFVNRIKKEDVDYTKYYDLSRPIRDVNLLLGRHLKAPTFAELDLPTVWKRFNGELVTAFRSGMLTIPTNICTHIDFPSHLAYSTNIIRNEYIFDEIHKYIGKCIVIDCSEIIEKNLNPYLNNSGHLNIKNKKHYLEIIQSLEISLDYFKQKLKDIFEINSIQELKNYFVLFYTSLDKYWGEKELYITQEWKFAYFLNPYLSQDLIDELVKADIKGIGSDTYRLENPLINISNFHEELFDIPDFIEDEFNKINEYNLLHYKLLSKNILIIENLTNLNLIKDDISMFMALPPRIQVKKANSDMFVRAIAFKISNPKKHSPD